MEIPAIESTADDRDCMDDSVSDGQGSPYVLKRPTMSEIWEKG